MNKERADRSKPYVGLNYPDESKGNEKATEEQKAEVTDLAEMAIYQWWEMKGKFQYHSFGEFLACAKVKTLMKTQE